MTTPPFAWIDLETTGLEPLVDRILEVSMIVTDDQLRPLAEPFSRVLHLERNFPLSPFILDMHGKNGLLDECYASTLHLGLVVAEAEQMLDALGLDPKPIIAGSSVHFDKGFLRARAPGFLDHFHYRLFDVSVLKEFARAYAPAVYESRPKPGAKHRGLSDLHDTMAEFRHYALHFADRAL